MQQCMQVFRMWPITLPLRHRCRRAQEKPSKYPEAQKLLRLQVRHRSKALCNSRDSVLCSCMLFCTMRFLMCFFPCLAHHFYSRLLLWRISGFQVDSSRSGCSANHWLSCRSESHYLFFDMVVFIWFRRACPDSRWVYHARNPGPIALNACTSSPEACSFFVG